MELKLQKDMNLGDHDKDGDEGREVGRRGQMDGQWTEEFEKVSDILIPPSFGLNI